MNRQEFNDAFERELNDILGCDNFRESYGPVLRDLDPDRMYLSLTHVRGINETEITDQKVKDLALGFVYGIGQLSPILEPMAEAGDKLLRIIKEFNPSKR
ncbi:MAG: hypothetical protein WC796_04160 [Candidatus Pacearchaeota archaeon]|jgi:hypothetical protein